MINEAIILAGGLGTRLRPAVQNVPKCMAPVNGKPFLSYLIDYYAGQGISKFIFSLGYKHGDIESFLKEKFCEEIISGNNYTVSLEEEPLGTGGAVYKACGIADSGQVLVLNGDTFFAAGIHSLTFFHERKASECTLGLKPMFGSNRYGVVEIDEGQRINSFKEKKWYAKGLINAGVYALSKNEFLKRSFPEKFSFEKEYLERFYNEANMYGYVEDKYFIDIGIPEDYFRAQQELLKNL